EESKTELLNIVTAASRFVPQMFLKILKKESIANIQLSDCVEKELTILFLDIRSFTTLSEFATSQESFEFVNDCLSYFEPCIIQNNGFIDKHIGDGFLAIFPNQPDDAVKAAITILQSLERYNYKRIMRKQVPIRIGVGINTGTVILGVIGFNDRT